MSDETAITLREMFTELRRLEDCVTYFQNRAIRQQIAIEEHARLLIAKANDEEAEPNEITDETDMDRRFGRRALTDEQVRRAIREHDGDYTLAAAHLGCSVTTVYSRFPKKRGEVARAV